MFRSVNRELEDMAENERSMLLLEMEFQAKIHGAKWRRPQETQDGLDDDETQNVIASLEAATQRQVEFLRQKAAREGARSGEGNNPKN